MVVTSGQDNGYSDDGGDDDDDIIPNGNLRIDSTAM